jgi:hypothetical protein
MRKRCVPQYERTPVIFSVAKYAPVRSPIVFRLLTCLQQRGGSDHYEKRTRGSVHSGC